MIDAGKFAQRLDLDDVDGEPRFFCFGLDAANAVAELRRFADAIERKEIMLQRVQTGSVAEPDDFATQAIMITFAEACAIPQTDRNACRQIGFGDQ